MARRWPIGVLTRSQTTSRTLEASLYHEALAMQYGRSVHAITEALDWLSFRSRWNWQTGVDDDDLMLFGTWVIGLPLEPGQGLIAHDPPFAHDVWVTRNGVFQC